MFESILCQVSEYDPDTLEPLIGLAVEIAREGREGRRVGTIFTLGDENAVLARSRPLILDPLLGHPEASRHISNLNLRGTIKELAQLDGGFVVSGKGIVLSACRYLDAVAAQVDVPLGLGSRHIAAANMSAVTKAVGIVVSESSVVRLFCHGQLVGEIIPELWMTAHAPHLRGAVKKEQVGELTVLTPNPRQAVTMKKGDQPLKHGTKTHDDATGIQL
jgi:diadenylate cyclase